VVIAAETSALPVKAAPKLMARSLALEALLQVLAERVQRDLFASISQ
jgi:hypothetical protein